MKMIFHSQFASWSQCLKCMFFLKGHVQDHCLVLEYKQIRFLVLAICTLPSKCPL